MKRLLILPLLICLLFAGANLAHATAGSAVLTSNTPISIDNRIQRVIVAITFTADSGTAAIPSYTLSPTAAAYLAYQSTYGIKGWYLYKVETDPGSPGPTNAAWDLDITDALGFLVSRNLLDNLSSTATQETIFTSGFPMIENTWTISIGDNAVNSATVVVYLTFVAN